MSSQAWEMGRNDLVRLQGGLCELGRAVTDVDVRSVESSLDERAGGVLAVMVLRLLDDVVEQLNTITARCEEFPPTSGPVSQQDWELQPLRDSYAPLERVLDSAVETRLGSVRVVEEMAFIAGLELRQRSERVRRLRRGANCRAILVECDGALRRIRKALEAVDAAIARACGVEPRLEFRSELQASLLVRAAYVRIRAQFEQLSQLSKPVSTRIRIAGTQIATAIGWDAYVHMRIADRLLMRELQVRILNWLADEVPDEIAGERLLVDLRGFAQMLTLINRRQELVEHDAGILTAALRQIRDDLDEAALRRQLIAVAGRSAEIDGWVSSGVRLGREGCELLIERALAHTAANSLGEAAATRPDANRKQDPAVLRSHVGSMLE